MVAAELDSFDGRTDPDLCSQLVVQLRQCQDKVIGICNEIIEEAIPSQRANRDFRVKFPDDVLHENFAGQLWFGAECLAAGSNIMNRELESARMRPLAKAVTKSLDNVRCLLREQSLKNSQGYSDKVKGALKIFDRLFAEFELCYVSAMVPVKSAKEYHLQQEIVILFSETLQRALRIGLVTQDMVDDYDPSLMFTIPRLAIVWGLLLYPEGTLNVDCDPADMSELFRPFYSLLYKIRDLLWTLSQVELHLLEKMLCSLEDPRTVLVSERLSTKDNQPSLDSEDYINLFYQNHRSCKQFIQDFYAYNFGVAPENEISSGDDALKSNEAWNEDYNQLEANKSEEEVEVVPENSIVSSEHITSQSVEFVSRSKEFESSVGLDISECCVQKNLSQVDKVSDVPLEGEFLSALEQSDDVVNTASDYTVQISQWTNCDNDSTNVTSDTVQSFESETELVDALATSLAHNQIMCLEDNENNVGEWSEECLCDSDVASCSAEEIALSRTLLSQVMQRLEIVPPPSYGSSPEQGTQPLEIRLLSRSFPVTSIFQKPSLHDHSPQIPPRWRRRRNAIRYKNRKRNTSNSSCDSNVACNERNSSRQLSQMCTCQKPVYNRQLRKLVEDESKPFNIPKVNRLQDYREHSCYCSSCPSMSSASSSDWDCSSPDTSSYNSECQDDEEIALALQAAEIASRNEARAKFKSSDDLLHRLFVCISGVADQLQTNYASDLRNILKNVFEMNCSESCSTKENLVQKTDCGNDSLSEVGEFHQNNNIEEEIGDISNIIIDTEDTDRDRTSVDSAEEMVPGISISSTDVHSSENLQAKYQFCCLSEPPPWLPDNLSAHCMACKAPFTIIRRRHHCRNCGKIFCSRCSSNSVPLPRYGHNKPVRVCNQCFSYQLACLVVSSQY
ncbi:lateral signaling target protein 2 homolog isoform X2 [Centruroides sculpturatus]|nr:lateral signaling target protein 2 homolog isoform X2 [Centruroides sculpturatus]